MSLRDIKLVNFSETSSSVSFTISSVLNPVIGRDNLIQRIVKKILTAKGSNVYDSTIGSSFANLFQVTSTTRIKEIENIFPIYLETMVEQLRDEQESEILEGITIPDGEYLENIIMESVAYDDTFGGWLVSLRVFTLNNSSFSLSIP